MEKKRVEDHEVETAPRVKVDKFGFVKPDQNSPEPGFIKSKSALEFERYSFFCFLKLSKAYELPFVVLEDYLSTLITLSSSPPSKEFVFQLFFYA